MAPRRPRRPPISPGARTRLAVSLLLALAACAGCAHAFQESDLHVYGHRPDMKMPSGTITAGWYLSVDTSGESSVVDAATQAQFCAYECVVTNAGNCAAFETDYTAGTCELMDAADVTDLTSLSGTNYYYLHPGTGATDATALNVWKNGLTSAGGSILSSWTGPPCSGDSAMWSYITCAHNRITSVILSNLGLEGSLDSNPSSGISQVPCLQEIDLTGNKFDSMLPSHWTNFLSLKTLVLADNQITGLLPTAWPTGFTSLEVLSLESNQLSGDIATPGWNDGFGGSLLALNLASNQLTGAVPVFGASYTTLEVLSLCGNQLSGVLPDLPNLAGALEIGLCENQLVGPLPTSWATDLTALETLSLRKNPIGTTLPTAWYATGTWGALASLDLSYAEVTGVLPVDLTNIDSLLDLSLANNGITGTLPPNWSTMTHLEALDLCGNSITGAVPLAWTEFGTGSMTALSLCNNELTGNLGSGAFAATFDPLQVLDLSGNAFSGALPTGMHTQFSSLEHLNLCHNSFTGSVPSSWTNWAALSVLRACHNDLDMDAYGLEDLMLNLLVLDLSHNGLVGYLPYSYPATYAPIEEINFCGNALSGYLPAEWTAYSDLKTISLCSNSLTSALPMEWTSTMTALEVLDLSHNMLSGEPLSASMTAWGSLLTLNLASNQFTGYLPDSLNFPSLVTLNLGDNSFWGVPDDDFNAWPADMPELETLVLSENGLSGLLPLSWTGFASLKKLDLYDNWLSGQLPGEWATCCSKFEHLSELNLSYNVFYGTIPTPWKTAFPAMEHLDLSLNHFSGSLPPEFTSYSEIRTLHLNSNQFSGALPAQWTDLAAIEVINVYNNQLTGTIDYGFGSLSTLTGLYVGYNGLTGGIPAQLATSNSLQHLDLSSNYLTWPSDIFNSSSLLSLDLSGNYFAQPLDFTWVLPSLQVLSLEDTGASGPFHTSTALQNFPSLITVALGSNPLTGSLPSSISTLANLEALSINSCGLSQSLESALATLAPLPALKRLEMAGSETHQMLTGAFPTTYNGPTTLVALEVGTNALTGELPSLAGLIVLEEIDVSGNQLTGPIPEVWSDLTALKSITASDNQLTGGIPAALSTLTEVTHLEIARAGLSGPAEADMSYMGLTHLDLSGNGISGMLPWDWQFLSSLKHLDMSANFMSGTIPGAWSALSELVRFDLTDNPWFNPSLDDLVDVFDSMGGGIEELRLEGTGITGTIPGELSDLWALKVLKLGRTYLENDGGFPGWMSQPNDIPLEELSFPEINFDGPLPFFKFEALKTLDLSGNSFSGTIPGPYSDLRKLEYFNVNGNELWGFLPVSWSELSHMSGFHAADNNFEGLLPSDWGISWENIAQLNVSSNKLTGSVPSSWLSSTRLQKLTVLDLSSNEMAGPLPDLQFADSVIELSLASNGFTGALPAWVSNMNSLATLSLSGNQLAGQIPPAFTMVASLEVLELNDNLLTGVLPVGLTSSATGLRVLSLGGNSLTSTSAALPSAFFNLAHLETLSLSSMALGGPLPVSPLDPSPLTTLNLTNCQFTGTIGPAFLNPLVGLEELHVSGNLLTGLLPPELSVLQDLTVLDISDNPFTPGAIPGVYASDVGLSTLLAAGCGLTGALPEDWSAWKPNLKVLDLSGNSISSTPLTWTSDCCFELKELNLAGNPLDMQPPSEWASNLMEVTNLDISNAGLVGTIPEAFGSMWYKMEHISLSGNSLTGTIPSSFSMAYTLKTLDLCNNSLTGTYPADLQPGSFFDTLETIRLCSNQLTGLLASSNFTGFPDLVELDLSNNNLTGTIPDSFSEFAELTTLDVSGNLLNGSLPYCSLANIPNLVSLSVHSNSLTGLLPSPADTFWTALASWEHSPGNSFSGNASSACNITAPWVDSTYIIDVDLSFSLATDDTFANDIGPTLLNELAAAIGRPEEYVIFHGSFLGGNGWTFQIRVLIPLYSSAEQATVESSGLLGLLNAADWPAIGIPANWTSVYGGPNIDTGTLLSRVVEDVPDSMHVDMDARPLSPGYYDNMDFETLTAESSSDGPTEDVIPVVGATIRFPIATDSDTFALMPMFLTSLSSHADLAEEDILITGITYDVALGLDIECSVIFPPFSRSISRRRHLMNSATDAANLAADLNDNPGDIFPSSEYGLYGTPSSPYQVTTWEHVGPPDSSVSPVDPGFYNNFDWDTVTTGGSPSVPSSSGPDYSSYYYAYSSYDYESFSGETLVVTFTARFFDLAESDWWSMGSEYVDILAERMGQTSSYVKVPGIEGNYGLDLETRLIIPLHMAADEAYYMDWVVDKLDPANNNAVLDGFGPPGTQYDVLELNTVVYDGLPSDPDMPQSAKPHQGPYWANYWSDAPSTDNNEPQPGDDGPPPGDYEPPPSGDGPQPSDDGPVSGYDSYAYGSFGYGSFGYGSYGSDYYTDDYSDDSMEPSGGLVTHIADFSVIFPDAVASDLQELGPLYVTAIANFVGVEAHRIKLYISEAMNGGIEFTTQIIFPESEGGSGTNRRLAQAGPDWLQEAESLFQALQQDISSVFSPALFASYGPPSLPPFIMPSTWSHSGPLDPWMEPLPPNSYDNFNWMSPDVFSPCLDCGAGGDLAGSDDYGYGYGSGFEFQTLLLTFVAEFPGLSQDDWWSVGPDYVKQMSTFIGYGDEYVKVFRDDDGPPGGVLALETTLILPIYSEYDMNAYQEQISMIDTTNPMDQPDAIRDLHQLVGPVQFFELEQNTYLGMPEDPWQMPEAKPLRFGYWMDYFHGDDGGEDDDGGNDDGHDNWDNGGYNSWDYGGYNSWDYGGYNSWDYGDYSSYGDDYGDDNGGYYSDDSGSVFTEMVVHVVSFYCSFETADAASLSGPGGLGLKYVTAVAESAGLGTERVKVWIYEGNGGVGIEFYTDVVFPQYEREASMGKGNGNDYGPAGSYGDYGAGGNFRRRLSQQAEDSWGEQMQDLEGKLRYSPGEVFPFFDFKDFGIAQVGTVSQWDHTGPLYDYLEPLMPGTYESQMFDWLSPDIFFPTSGGPGSGGMGFMEETLVFQFDVNFEFVLWDDFWSLGPSYVDALEALIAPLTREYIKIHDAYEDYYGGLTIYTSLIIPLEAEGDYSLWQQVAQSLQYEASLVFAALSGWGPAEVTYFYETTYPGLPFQPGAADDIVPHEPGYWEEYFSGEAPESGGGFNSYTEIITQVLSFRVDFSKAKTAEVGELGQKYVSALASFAGDMDKENIKILQILVQEPGLGFVTELTLPSFEEQFSMRRKLAQMPVNGQVDWREISSDLQWALDSQTETIFSEREFGKYGQATMVGQVLMQEFWGEVDDRYKPLPLGTYSPGGFNWEGLADGVGMLPPPSVDYGGSYGEYYGGYGDYYGDYEEPEDTMTLLVSFKVAFMTSNGCDFSDNFFSMGFLNWYHDALMEYFMEAGVYGIHFDSITATVELASSLGAALGGPCDVPVQVDTSVAFPAFVPDDVAGAGAARYDADSFSSDVNNKPNSIWKDPWPCAYGSSMGEYEYGNGNGFDEYGPTNAGGGCDYVNPSPVTLVKSSTFEWTNVGGMPFYFQVPKLLSVGIPLDYLMDMPGYGSYGSYGYYYDDNSDYGDDPPLPGGGGSPGPGTPNTPGAPAGPGTPANPGHGPSGPGGGEVEVDVVSVSLTFLDIFSFMDRDSEEMYSLMEAVHDAVSSLSGVPREFIDGNSFGSGNSGYELQLMIYFVPEDISTGEEYYDNDYGGYGSEPYGSSYYYEEDYKRRRLLAAGQDFASQISGALLGSLVRDELSAMGVDVPFDIVSSEPEVSTAMISSGGGLPVPDWAPGQPNNEPYSDYYYPDYYYPDYGNYYGDYYDDPNPSDPGAGPGPGFPGSPGNPGQGEEMGSEYYYEEYEEYYYEEPAVEWLPFVPVISFKMAFTTLTFQGLNSTAGAGPAFCDFYREMISNLAFVDFYDVQLKTISPNPQTTNLEILTRVRLMPVYVERQVDGPEGVTFPGPAADALADVWASLADFESKISKVNLLKGTWDDPRLPLGTLLVNSKTVPSPGHFMFPKVGNWWTFEQVDDNGWETLPKLCTSSAAGIQDETTMMPTPEPVISQFDRVQEEQDLNALAELATDLDLGALLGEPETPFVPTPEPFDDFLVGLDISFLGVPEETTPVLPAPVATQPPLDLSFLQQETTVIEEEEEEQDLTPPVCTLNPTTTGQTATVTRYMFTGTFTDPLAKCIDGGENLPLSSISRAMFFMDYDGSWSPADKVELDLGIEISYRITYMATDAAGNPSSVIKRRVEVKDPCKDRSPPTELCLSETKAEILAGTGAIVCSVPGLSTKVCNPDLLGDSSDEEEEVEEEEVEPDTTPPTIIVRLGDGKLQTTTDATGATIEVVVHSYEVTREENIYVDAGFDAEDDRDPVEQLKMKALGAGAVTTMYPTTSPFQVRYSAEDSSGNVSPQKIRVINVVCPPGEIICEREEGDLGSKCSVTLGEGEPQCGDGGDALADLAAAGLTSGDDEGDSFFADSLASEEEVAVVEEPVTQLSCGFLSTTVELGESYTKCTAADEGGTVCDPGCTAIDGPNGDGDISQLVEACPNSNPNAAKRYFSDVGLKFCGIDTATIGEYEVEFCVESSRGEASRVCATRVVFVSPVCEGERVCSDGVTCSVDNQCVNELSSGLDNLEDEDDPEIIEPPTVTLKGPTSVSLPRGTKYRKCQGDGNDLPTDENPCDQGLEAFDHDVDSKLVNITSKVFVCPNTACFNSGKGCSGAEYVSTSRGKPGEPLLCASLNHMAPVGTVINLRFMALDNTYPFTEANTTVTRTITISEPCLEGEFVCEDLEAGTLECSKVACDQRDAIIPAEVEDREPVVWLNGDALLRVGYGEPLDFNLFFCTDLEQTDCGAYALAEEGGESVVPRDLIITSAACKPADAAAGTCLPGAYALRYQAYDSAGRQSNTATRILIVEQRGVVDIPVELPLGDLSGEGDAGLAAEVEAERYRVNDYMNNATQVYIDAFIESYGANNSDINANTVAITDVSTSQDVSGGWVITVTFSVTVSSSLIEDTSSADSPTARRLLDTHIATGRRLLQTSSLSAKLDGVVSGLSSTAGGFASAVTAQAEAAGQEAISPVVSSEPTSGTTTPEVDILGGLIAQLSAGVESYEEAYISTAFRLSNVMTEAQKSVGEGLNQAELATDTKIQADFKTMLEDNDATMAKNMKSLTQILVMFEDALATQLALNAGLSATMESIQESLAAQAAFLKEITTTQVFIETIIGPNWDGTGTAPACPQAEAYGDYFFEFGVFFGNATIEQLNSDETANYQEEETEEDTKRRKLLIGGGGGSGSKSNAFGDTDTNVFIASEEAYFGYQLIVNAEDTRAWDLSGKGAVTRARYLGGPDRNRVMGGLMIHQTRKPMDTTYCEDSTLGPWGSKQLPGAKFTKLSPECAQRLFMQELDPTGRLFKQWDAIQTNRTHPFGSDPIWIRSSDLFSPDMGGAEGEFYNMARGSEETNKFSETMYAHFPREVPGKEMGFPIYVDVALDTIRLAELLVYIENSNYMDKKSQTMTIQLGVYNPTLQVFGYGRADVERDMNGIWESTMTFNGLSALSHDVDTPEGQLAVLGENLAVFCATGYLLWWLYAVFSHSHFSVHVARACKWAVDLVIIIAMAVALYMYYQIVQDLLQFTAEEQYEVYDAVTYAPARFLLPSKVNTTLMAQEDVSLIEAQFAEEGRPTGWAESPGQPGRWELPTNETGMQDYGRMMESIDSISDRKALYGAFQGLIMLAMIFRMLYLWNFQDQVGIVTRTLFSVLPDLGEFALVLGILMMLYACYGIIVAGSHVSHYTTITDAFYSLFIIIVAADGGEMHDFAHDDSAEFLMVEKWNIDFWYISLWIFFFFVLTSYLLGYIGYTLAYEKEISDSGNSPSDEVAALLRTNWQQIRRWAPSNKAIAKRMEHLLDGLDNEIDLSTILRKQLQLAEDDVRLSVVHLEEPYPQNLDHQDLEHMLFAAHNLARRQELSGGKPAALKRSSTKELSQDILKAVVSIMSIHGENFSVDLELVEEIMAMEQHNVYEKVVAAVVPAYEAAAELWTEQASLMEEMEMMSWELCQAARARGDSSMKPFQSNMGKQVAPAPRLEYETTDSTPYSHPHAVPRKLTEESPSVEGSASSAGALKKGAANGSRVGPAHAAHDQVEESRGALGHIGRALRSLMWGVIGGSTRRVQQRGPTDEDGPGETDQLI